MPPQPPTWPVLQFDKQAYNISENGGKITINVTREGTIYLPASINYSIAGGSALQGTDYSGGAGVLSFIAGAISASINITITNDVTYETNETIILSLSNPENATIGSNSTIMITIVNDDAAPVIKFSTASYSFRENVSTLTVQAFCNGSTSLSATIHYAVTGGNATAGTDYTGGSGTMSFAPGTSIASFTMNVLNDAVHEGNETIILTLSNPANATIATPSSTTVTILDNDAPPVLQFNAVQYVANENAGIITVQVNLAGSTSLPASITYAVTGGNATAGTDYTGGSGTLSFTPGAMTATFNVNIVNDNVYEGNQTIVIFLSTPVNATIGTNATTTIVIRDNDALPSLRFSASAYSVNENAGVISVPVNLVGSTELPASINYAVTGGNATAGTDYTGGSGTMTFSPGTTLLSFDLSILNDATYESNETITLSISSPKNATTGSPGTTTITIIDDENQPLPTVIISLVTGWNLISIPLMPENNSVGILLPASVRNGLVNIWGWDEARQDWSFYSNDPGDYFYLYYPAITRLETGKAYWIEMNKSATLTIQGTVPVNAPGSPVTLVSGWSFVGPTGQTNSTPTAMYPGVVDVWGWDETQQDWVYYSPDSNDYFNQYYPRINEIIPGHGYWIEKT